MKPGAGLPDGWRGTVLALYAQGFSLRKCALAADIHVNTLIRHRDENFQGFADDLKAAGEAFNDRIRDEIVDRAFDKQHRGSDMWLERLAQWKLPEARPEAQRIEVSGQVAVGHEARLTLAHVVGLAERLGLGGSARAELPAARGVLSEPDDD